MTSSLRQRAAEHAPAADVHWTPLRDLAELDAALARLHIPDDATPEYVAVAVQLRGYWVGPRLLAEWARRRQT